MSPAGPWRNRRLHFIGVAGAGMSAYARAAHALGAEISGSDSGDSEHLRGLRRDGILRPSIGHRAENLPAAECLEVVYSSAVPADNPERLAAAERGLTQLTRAQLLGELSALRRTIAVAGTHGKSTTCSMLVHILRAGGLDPGWLVGATVGGGLPNGHWSEGEWLIVEADESDRSMLSLSVEIAVLTNVELDHHAAFGSLAQLSEVFKQFLQGAPEAVIWDSPELHELRSDIPAEDPGAPVGRTVYYDVSDLQLKAGSSSFRWRGEPIDLPVAGEHNALNAVGALEAARLAGVQSADGARGLASFHGAGRRFQRLGETARGGVVYDDYAHHPTEVRATLSAARTLRHSRLIAVFQPHLYSRTALLAREFGSALALADVIVALDVYPARERAEDHPGVSGLLLAAAAADAAAGKTVYWLPKFTDAEPVLRGLLGDGDVCVVMGAGDVDALARKLLDSDSVDVQR